MTSHNGGILLMHHLVITFTSNKRSWHQNVSCCNACLYQHYNIVHTVSSPLHTTISIPRKSLQHVMTLKADGYNFNKISKRGVGC